MTGYEYDYDRQDAQAYASLLCAKVNNFKYFRICVFYVSIC